MFTQEDENDHDNGNNAAANRRWEESDIDSILSQAANSNKNKYKNKNKNQNSNNGNDDQMVNTTNNDDNRNNNNNGNSDGDFVFNRGTFINSNDEVNTDPNDLNFWKNMFATVWDDTSQSMGDKLWRRLHDLERQFENGKLHPNIDLDTDNNANTKKNTNMNSNGNTNDENSNCYINSRKGKQREKSEYNGATFDNNKELKEWWEKFEQHMTNIIEKKLNGEIKIDDIRDELYIVSSIDSIVIEYWCNDDQASFCRKCKKVLPQRSCDSKYLSINENFSWSRKG